MPPSQFWYCTIGNYFLFSSTLTSTYIIINMTFDRFYSIIKPHRAALMNTIKRAKITISCICLLSFICNIPHWFLSTALDNKFCQPFHLYLDKWYNGAFFWLSMVLSYAVPFICLLIMNICIIYTINNSVKKAQVNKRYTQKTGETLNEKEDGRSGETDTQRTKHLAIQREQSQTKEKYSELQIYVTLLSVTFSFLILTFPTYAYFFYARVYGDSSENAKYSALSFFLAQLSHKLYYVNNGINFFLYVFAGSKFRKDVLKLCHCGGKNDSNVSLGSRASDFTNSSTTAHP